MTNKEAIARLRAMEANLAGAEKALLFAAIAMDARPTASQICELLDCAREFRNLARRVHRTTHARTAAKGSPVQ